MTTSKEVTALRKSGKLEAAYQLSLKLISSPTADDWDRAAYAWCLVSLVKYAAREDNQAKLNGYLTELQSFEVPTENILLAEHRVNALALGRSERRAVLEARELSKQGNHANAAHIYADLHAQGELQTEDKRSWGWELYRLIKAEFQNNDTEKISPSSVQRIKRNLNTYLKLGLKGPDLLHSLMLQQALRLTKEDHLKVLPFLRLWGPDQFSEEDLASQTGKDGKTYASLAERAIQAAASEAADSDRIDDIRFILQHVESAMIRFPENVWLKLNLVKLLRGLGRTDEARELAVEFAREKANEYWVWDLIGDLSKDEPGLQLSCYAKALSCSQDDVFVGKVRLKLAAHLADQHPAEARFEVEQVLSHRARAGYRVPQEAQAMSESAWYASVAPQVTGREFYARFTDEAEALLFSHLPWTEASLGDVFTIEGRDGSKPRRRRRIYVKDKLVALELSLPDSNPDVRSLAEGTPLLVQYEMSKADAARATIHMIRPRPDGSPLDAAPELIGIIDHVNIKKSVLHVIVARGVDGTCPISAFPGQTKAGMFVKVRLSRHKSRNGERTRIIWISPSEEPPASDIYRQFCELVEVTESGLGFTVDDIFIPPNIVAQAGIESGDLVEGTAAISYDKKRGKWGLKAIEARPV
jgi:Domain of unknown function (DUF7017)/S1/CSD-like domain 1 of the TOTE conflict systems/S1/CSD-like domain 2 of the TOTE conflict systems